ncbi:MAG TPA: VOC family protein [Thermomicrobiales bacterium]|nr:VOC family protein [Thermomicrobiales bacterium]HRA46456.1 VOC family protein [Thermomicrobiales bacterium]
MQSGFGHIQFNVRDTSLPFYRDLFAFLGWTEIYADESMAGFSDSGAGSFWFTAGGKGVVNDYDGPGVNHVAIATTSQGDVDAAAAHLTAKGIDMLFDTPRHRPEFSHGEADTYYQIMFETPDHFLLEVVYTGPK